MIVVQPYQIRESNPELDAALDVISDKVDLISVSLQKMFKKVEDFFFVA